MGTLNIKDTTSSGAKTRVHLAPNQIRKLRVDYYNGMSIGEIMLKYDISKGPAYRYTKKVREMMKTQGVTQQDVMDSKVEWQKKHDAKLEEQNNMQEQAPMEGWINMRDLSEDASRYLRGMALAFGKSEEAIIEDLVEVAVEIGTAHIHAKKAE